MSALRSRLARYAEKTGLRVPVGKRDVDTLREHVRAVVPSVSNSAANRGRHASFSLPFEPVETPYGTASVRRESVLLPYRHGAAELDASEFHGDALALLTLDENVKGIDPKSFLFLDTETTGLSGGSGTLAFLMGLAYMRDGALQLEQLFLRQPSDERALLARLSERLESCSAIVTYNGKSFDWPLLRTRYVLNRLPMPTPAYHIDLLHCVRRLAQGTLERVRLQDAERALVQFERTDDVDGSSAPAAYRAFLKNGDDRLLLGIVEHNRLDVLALPTLLRALEGKLLGYAPAQPHEMLCASKLAARMGYMEWLDRFAHAAARSADRSVAAATCMVRALALFRRRRFAECEAAFYDALAAVPDSDIHQRSRVHLALAKLLEHRLSRPEQALAHAQHTAAVEGHERWSRRIARLNARIRQALAPGPLQLQF